MKRKIITIILALVISILTITMPTAQALAAEQNDFKSIKISSAITTHSLVNNSSTIYSAAVEENRIAAIKIGCPTAFINGKKSQIDTTNNKVVPIIVGGRTMIPLRFCATAMGGTTNYISAAEYITVTLREKIAKFKINSKTLLIVDSTGKKLKTITMDVPATLQNGRVQVPIRAISEGLGCKVYYKKIRTDEMVLVSQYDLAEPDRDYYMAQLQNLGSFTFKDSEKNYQVKLPGAWSVSGEDKENNTSNAYFENPLYPMSMYSFSAGSKNLSEVNAHLKLSKNQLKEVYESELESILGYDDIELIDYKKYTVNGKNALYFAIKIVYDGEIIYMDFFMTASSKTAVLATCVAGKNDYSRTQFKSACDTIKLLK